MLRGINISIILLMIIMVVSVNLGVLSRYVLDVSLSWTGELSSYTLIWLTFLGSAYAVFHKTHLRFEGILERFPNLLQLTIKIIFAFLIITFFLIVVVFGISLTINSMHNATLTLPISKGVIYSIIPISCVMIIIGLIKELKETIKGER